MVIDLARLQPDTPTFIAAIVREMRIRFYQQKTVKAYRNPSRRRLGWWGRPPQELTREALREYLELLVNAGAGAS